MSYRAARRLSPIVLLLFPALWGWLGLLNNVSGFSGTRDFAVRPMLEMSDTYGNPAQTWRAVTAPWAATVALVAITAAEALAGLFSTIGIIRLIGARGGSGETFDAAKTAGIYGCLLAIMVWGIGFMVIAGDWFLSWQSASSIDGQLGGMIYALPSMLALVVLLLPEPPDGR